MHSPVAMILTFIALLSAVLLPVLAVAYRQAATPGRHRLTPATDPNRRDWAAIAAERINAGPALEPVPEPIKYGLLDPQMPLAEVEEYLRTIDVTRELETIQ